MQIEIELVGNLADRYEITTQILDILLKTSADIGYSYQTINENGKVFVTSRKLHLYKNKEE